jgi:hypothetical protein
MTDEREPHRLRKRLETLRANVASLHHQSHFDNAWKRGYNAATETFVRDLDFILRTEEAPTEQEECGCGKCDECFERMVDSAPERPGKL